MCFMHKYLPSFALLALFALGALPTASAAVPGAGSTPAATVASSAAMPGVTPDPADLARKIAAFLKEQASSYPGDPKVTVEPPETGKLTACNHVQVFLPSGARLRSQMNVGVRCLAPQPWVIHTQASLSVQGSFYVPVQTLKPGTVLSADNLEPRAVDLLTLPASVVTDAEQLIGSITTQRINAGSAIKASALRSAQSVQRGQMVRLEARGVGFVATGEGKAMQNGEPGSRIQVRTNSGQLVSGTVIDAATVRVL